MTFMQEYRAGTAPSRKHPGWRVWHKVCSLYVTESGGRWIYLRRIASLHSRRGHGSRCLHWLLDLAWKYDKIIYGHASNDFAGKIDKPSVMELRRWYRKHGAKIDRRGGFTFHFG